MTVRVKVDGLKEINRKLQRLPAHVRGRHMAAALMRGAEPIRRDAEANAPVLSGNLSRGMQKDVEETEPTHAVVAVGPEEEDFYGIFQELGTKYHAAQPFLEPAFDANARKAIDIVADDLGRRVERAAR
ncbi:MAG: HK97 gp10 family phage protein [Acidobacteriota bacterium]|nr:HK97 gp10 family phage protein [Acidobacteriota bacterium]